MHITRRTLLRASLAAAGVALAGCGATESPSAPSDQLQSSFFCFDTACVVGGVMAQEQLDAAVARCQWFEEHLSRTREDSDVARINAAQGAPVVVEPETAELIARALAYGAESDGAFDITIGAVTRLWDFHEGVVPAPEQIAAALPHVDYRAVHVDEDACTVTLDDPETALDLGGIAKGFIADTILDELEDAGVTSAFVNLGGNVKVLGAKPDGSPWRVGVRDPESDAESARSIARVTLEGGSVVTSGLYERQFERNGRRYWHILDPKTGYPVESDVVSATIVSERSIDGDGYTKPLFMMGAERALAWAAEHPEFQVLLVDDAGGLHMQPDGAFELL